MSSTPDQQVATQEAQDLTGASRKRRGELARSWRRFKRFKPGVVAAGFVIFLAIIAIAPGIFEPHDYAQPDPRLRGSGPTWDHPLGHDLIGRDILSRLIRGTRVAFTVGLAATTISVLIGVTVGSLSGFFGGWIDTIFSRIVDTLMAFPLLVLLLTLSAVIGPSLRTTVIVIGLTLWSSYARVVRADVLSVRERDFVLAARAVGANNSRIIVRHIIPNVMGPVIVLASLAVGSVIILEAALSFLGLGVQPPTPSWGGMLSEGRGYMRDYPLLSIAPGVMIFLTVLAFNLIGDGLRDALDPRQRD